MRRYAENVIIFVQQRIQRGKHSFLNLPFGFAARITDVKFLGIFPTAADIRPQFVKLGRRNSFRFAETAFPKLFPIFNRQI